MENYKERILIVEDEVLIAYSIEKMLQPNFATEMAHDFEEAKMLLTHQQFDLVLIDIMLSGGKTGIDLAHFINENNSIPFIFTTALTDLETLKRVTSVAPSAYLSKPVEYANLLTAITLALQNHDQFFKINIGKQVYSVKSHDFLYAEAHHIYVQLFLKSGNNHLLRITMSHLKDLIPEKYFKRISRSIAVNPYHITKIVHENLFLCDKVFKISKNY